MILRSCAFSKVPLRTKEYYSILHLRSDATSDEIKLAFYNLATFYNQQSDSSHRAKFELV